MVCDGGEGEDALHPGKAFADALTTAAGEWKEGEARTQLCGLFGFGRETVGVEAKRFRVEGGALWTTNWGAAMLVLGRMSSPAAVMRASPFAV